MAKDKSVHFNINISGDNYVGELANRLEEYGITRSELAAEMGIELPQLSRWLNQRNPSGNPIQPQFKNIMRIEVALAACRARKKKEKKRK